MTSYLDMPDASLLTLVGRLDRDALGALFHRYGTVVLVAAGWTETSAADAEQRTVDVFIDVWKRPAAYAGGAEPTRSHLIRAVLQGATEEGARLAAARLARLEGWTYHDVADVLARPRRQVALMLRDQLTAFRDDASE
jgi:DNA-directed RNA polymerase specialized sigma24 family protein